MRDRSSELLWLIGAVDAVAVAELESIVAEHFVVVTLFRIDRRNHDGVAGDDRLSRRQFALDAVVDFDDRVAAHFQHATAAVVVAAEPRPKPLLRSARRLSGVGVERSAGIEMHDAHPVLVRFFDEVPVRRHPQRVFFFRRDVKLADRRIEHARLAVD